MTMPIVDLHCHFLPGIDDGPSTMEEAVALARMAADNGITHAVVTPHLHPGRWENPLRKIQPLFEGFKAAVTLAGIPLHLGLACEARLDIELLDHLKRGQLPFLGHVGEDSIMLLELPHGQIPLGTEIFIRKLREMRIRPIIAHPERNKDAMRSRERLKPLIAEGASIQLTAGSLLGEFGSKTQEVAEELLHWPATVLIASDAHNTSVRVPELLAAKEAAASIIGDEAAMRLVSTNPWKIARTQFQPMMRSSSAA